MHAIQSAAGAKGFSFGVVQHPTAVVLVSCACATAVILPRQEPRLRTDSWRLPQPPPLATPRQVSNLPETRLQSGTTRSTTEPRLEIAQSYRVLWVLQEVIDYNLQGKRINQHTCMAAFQGSTPSISGSCSESNILSSEAEYATACAIAGA